MRAVPTPTGSFDTEKAAETNTENTEQDLLGVLGC
jgi:hypothetical protein